MHQQEWHIAWYVTCSKQQRPHYNPINVTSSRTQFITGLQTWGSVDHRTQSENKKSTHSTKHSTPPLYYMAPHRSDNTHMDIPTNKFTSKRRKHLLIHSPRAMQYAQIAQAPPYMLSAIILIRAIYTQGRHLRYTNICIIYAFFSRQIPNLCGRRRAQCVAGTFYWSRALETLLRAQSFDERVISEFA